MATRRTEDPTSMAAPRCERMATCQPACQQRPSDGQTVAVKAVAPMHHDVHSLATPASPRTPGPLCRSGGPLLGNNLSVIGMAFADTVMAGQLGARDLAGLAVGVGYSTCSCSWASACSWRCRRASRTPTARTTRRSDALRASVVVARARACSDAGRRAAAGGWVLPAIGIAPDILPVAIGYVHAMSWGMPGTAGVLRAALHQRRTRSHQAHHVHRLSAL